MFGGSGALNRACSSLGRVHLPESYPCAAMVLVLIGREPPATGHGKTPEPPPPPRPATVARSATMAAAMDALKAAERVLKGIRNNDLYVLKTPDLEMTYVAERDRKQCERKARTRKA